MSGRRGNKNNRNKRNNNKPHTKRSEADLTCRGYVNMDMTKITTNEEKLDKIVKAIQWYKHAYTRMDWDAVAALVDNAAKCAIPPELIRVFRDMKESKQQILDYFPQLHADFIFYQRIVGTSGVAVGANPFRDIHNAVITLSNESVVLTTGLFLKKSLLFGSLNFAETMANVKNMQTLWDAIQESGMQIKNIYAIPLRIDFQEVPHAFFYAHYADASNNTFILTVPFVINISTGMLWASRVMTFSDYESKFNNIRLVEDTVDNLQQVFNINKRAGSMSNYARAVRV